MIRPIVLEVAIESVQDAMTAARNGADRLELCAALDQGGLTPSAATISQVAASVDIPVMVMIRPRNGEFTYDESELSVMESDLTAAIESGADGLVFGVLEGNAALHIESMRRLIGRCAGRTLVFHRAFDFVRDPFTCLDQLIDLGVTRVLTSGQQARVSQPEALRRICELQDYAAGRIEILPGGGVRTDNLEVIVRKTSCTQIHGSFRKRGMDQSVQARKSLPLSKQMTAAGDTRGSIDGATVANVRTMLDQLV